jgi:hypothetical protein
MDRRGPNRSAKTHRNSRLPKRAVHRFEYRDLITDHLRGPQLGSLSNSQHEVLQHACTCVHLWPGCSKSEATPPAPSSARREANDDNSCAVPSRSASATTAIVVRRAECGRQTSRRHAWRTRARRPAATGQARAYPPFFLSGRFSETSAAWQEPRTACVRGRLPALVRVQVAQRVGAAVVELNVLRGVHARPNADRGADDERDGLSFGFSRGLGRRSIVATLVKEFVWEPVDEHRGRCRRV